MVGLGPGARSYTRTLHYSMEYAVGRAGVLNVIADFNRRTRSQFSWANHGYELDEEEQKRRFLLKSLLRNDGLKLGEYWKSFSSEAFADFPQLLELVDGNFAWETDGSLRLTPAGFELSDVIGPWLWSATVRHRMSQFVLK